MKLVPFLARYLVRYWRWAILAAVATLTYAAMTVVLLQPVQAIFKEVLHSDGGGMFPTTVASPAATGTPAGLAGAPAAIAQAPGVGSTKVFLDRFLNQGYERLKSALGITPATVIYFVPALFVIIFVLRSVSDFLNGYAFQRIGFGATTDLRNDLYARTLEQSSRFHSEHPSGELVSRVVHDVGVLQAAISTRLVDLFQQSFTLAGLLVLLFSIHFRLALFCLVAAPAVLYPIVRFAKGMRRTSHRAQERTADLANLVAEVSRGHRVVKAFGM
jgi:ABC-type multidrug transport system fused ATPase/permease subunit